MRSCATCGIAKVETDFYPKKRHCKACLLADRKAKYRSDSAMRQRLIERARRVAEEQSGRLLARECKRCGKAMRRSRDGTPGMCADCKWRHGYKLNISKSDRLTIYDRDNWTCGICCEPVDPDLHSNDVWGATLDHIVPRSLGGPDEPSNLRLAHRRCNSVRGARIDLPLSA